MPAATPQSGQVDAETRIHRAAMASIGVALAVMGLKYAAYQATGSIALYSDALESIVNLVTAVAAYWAVRISSLPADRNHPFGHHKAEYLSAVLEGALIIVAALMIFREVYDHLLSPQPLEATGLGLVFNGAATVLNGVWSYFLMSRGRRWRSPALVADGHHLLTDVLTSVGVITGLALAYLTGAAILDPLLALAVAAYILWSGYRITLSSISSLMDEAAGSELQQQIRECIKSSGHGAIEAHDIRTRRAGRVTFIEFHLVVPGTMTVHESHQICDCIEQEIESAIEGTEVVIHVEPENKAKVNARGAVKL
jgi:cation diffusion facilitator family transporter